MMAIHHDEWVGGQLVATYERGCEISHHLCVNIQTQGLLFSDETVSDGVIVAVMREFNEREEHNDDNTVSNERMREKRR